VDLGVRRMAVSQMRHGAGPGFKPGYPVHSTYTFHHISVYLSADDDDSSLTSCLQHRSPRRPLLPALRLALEVFTIYLGDLHPTHPDC
jgi:hypothetical protein